MSNNNALNNINLENNSNTSDDDVIGIILVLFFIGIIVAVIVVVVKVVQANAAAAAAAAGRTPGPSPRAPGPAPYQAPLIDIPPPPSTIETVFTKIKDLVIQALLSALIPGGILEDVFKVAFRTLFELLKGTARVSQFVARSVSRRLASMTIVAKLKRMMDILPFNVFINLITKLGARLSSFLASKGRTAADISAAKGLTASIDDLAEVAARRSAAGAAARSAAGFADAFDIIGIVDLGLTLSNTGNLSEYTSANDWNKIAQQFENDVRQAFNEARAAAPAGTPEEDMPPTYPAIIGPLDKIDQVTLEQTVLNVCFDICMDPPTTTTDPVHTAVVNILTNLGQQASAAGGEIDPAVLAVGIASGGISEADWDVIATEALNRICIQYNGQLITGANGAKRCTYATSAACIAASNDYLDTTDTKDTFNTEWRSQRWFAQFPGHSAPNGGCILYPKELQEQCESPVTTAIGTARESYDKTRGYCENTAEMCRIKGIDTFRSDRVSPWFDDGGAWLDSCEPSTAQRIAEILIGPTVVRYMVHALTPTIQVISSGQANPVTLSTQALEDYNTEDIFKAGPGYAPLWDPTPSEPWRTVCRGDDRKIASSIGTYCYETCPAGKMRGESVDVFNESYIGNCYTCGLSRSNLAVHRRPCDYNLGYGGPVPPSCPSGSTLAADNATCCPSGSYFTGITGKCCPNGTTARSDGDCCPAGTTLGSDNLTCCPSGQYFTGISGKCCLDDTIPSVDGTTCEAAPAHGTVELYTGCNYTGTKVVLGVGTHVFYPTSDSGFPNNQLKSFRIGVNTEIRMWENVDLSGSYGFFARPKHSQKCLTTSYPSLDNKISKVIIYNTPTIGDTPTVI